MSAPYIAFLSLGPVEIVVILLVALLVFGRRLPEVARSLGQGLTEFRKGLHDEPGSSDAPRPLPEQPPKDEPSGLSENVAEDVVEYDADTPPEDPDSTGDEGDKTSPA